MYAITSLFEESASEATRSFWETLEINCGLSGVKTSPYPHFSWLATTDFLWDPVSEKLEMLCETLPPFQVQTAGLGIFTGSKPILYISLVKTAQLLNIHSKIWNAVFPFLKDPILYYSPEHWIPHITVAYGDLTIQNLPCAIQGMMDKPIDFVLEIKKISVLFHTSEEVGIKAVFPLRGHLLE
jgi:hypothetical protein